MPTKCLTLHNGSLGVGLFGRDGFWEEQLPREVEGRQEEWGEKGHSGLGPHTGDK